MEDHASQIEHVAQSSVVKRLIGSVLKSLPFRVLNRSKLHLWEFNVKPFSFQLVFGIIWAFHRKRKRSVLWQNLMQSGNKLVNMQHKDDTKIFDKTTIAEQLRMVSRISA